MREIKFRAWDGEDKVMHYPPLELDINEDGHVEISKWLNEDDYSTKLGCTHDKCTLKTF